MQPEPRGHVDMLNACSNESNRFVRSIVEVQRRKIWRMPKPWLGARDGSSQPRCFAVESGFLERSAPKPAARVSESPARAERWLRRAQPTDKSEPKPLVTR